MSEQAKIDELLRQALEVARRRKRGIVAELIVLAIEENITVEACHKRKA
ncbi:hypothetical protein [Ciceribacter sp. L1K22]|nr:hypothetical protein [Ciceribacter sp. L1K22]MBO3760359.1 hypothetical protein [Ciceribacter sp. L1K22]